MKVRDVMTSHPILVRADERAPGDLHRLMLAGEVHHIPVVDGPWLVGVWVATDEGPLVMVGRERIFETSPDADAAEAIRALLDDSEAVFVWDSGVPAGVLTRTDVKAIVTTALGRGVGRRHPRPVVIRLAGPGGAGKTTLLMRTLALLGRLDVAVIQANAEAGSEGRLQGGRAIFEPGAHWRKGLRQAVERLSDAQVILVEDRDGPVDLAHGIGEDIQVAVVPVTDAPALTAEQLSDAQAVVVTKADAVPLHEAQHAVEDLQDRCPGVEVFAVAAGHDDRRLDAWTRWIEQCVLSRHN